MAFSGPTAPSNLCLPSTRNSSCCSFAISCCRSFCAWERFIRRPSKFSIVSRTPASLLSKACRFRPAIPRPAKNLLLALILLPALAGSAALFLRNSAALRFLLPAAALGHSLLVLACLIHRPDAAFGGWVRLDAAGMLILGISSFLFLLVSVYAVGYLAEESPQDRQDFEENFLFHDAPESMFVGCMLLFLASMTLVSVSRHLGLLWIGIESTTLTSAPLIYFHRHHRSLEATWKYLMVCSVGIALALLGIFFLGVSAAAVTEIRNPLLIDELIPRARQLNLPWLKAAVILVLVGYGTKMGLAPLHTWLPDAHSESPSAVSALLSGALLNCAFLGIFRVVGLASAAGQAEFISKGLLALGIGSVLVGAFFMIRQGDYKRLLAYSSVEHMGLLAVGLSLGPGGTQGALFHAVNHSLAKGMLFLLAGRILGSFRTKSVERIRGLLQRMPWTGGLWLVGFLAITGTPPFGPFFSKFMILQSAFDAGRWLAAVLLLVLLAFAFVGMAGAFLPMALGSPSTPPVNSGTGRNLGFMAPPALLAVLLLWIGIYPPAALMNLLAEAVLSLGGLP